MSTMMVRPVWIVVVVDDVVVVVGGCVLDDGTQGQFE